MTIGVEVLGRDMRLYLLVRRDLKMPAGKLAAMAGHAFVDCAVKYASGSEVHQSVFNGYQRDGQTKIVLGVADLNQLLRLRDAAAANFICTSTVLDEGRTVFPAHTIPVCAVGLCRREDLPLEFETLGLY
jgi:PTH2 family peptidyl-tRNA hydrolase